MFTLTRESHESVIARRLIEALDLELTAQYPEEGATFFELLAVDVTEGHGAFLVAWEGTEPVGCGAVRKLTDDRVELKRMYVVPNFRGKGVGCALLSALEDIARSLGARELVLETGSRQVAAVHMYERAGFGAIASFGPYANSPLSVCLGKVLRRHDP